MFILVILLMFISGSGFFWIIDGLIDEPLKQLFFYIFDTALNLGYKAMSYIDWSFLPDITFADIIDKMPPETLDILFYLRIDEAIAIIIGAVILRIGLNIAKPFIPFF